MKDLSTIISDLKGLTQGTPWGLKDRLEQFIKVLEAEKGQPKQRTDTQNRALHLWFTLLAEELNNSGYTVQLVLKEKIDLDWDSGKVKELLWRPAQIAILGKGSTTELSKQMDIDKVWEHLNRHIGEKFGIHVPFPHQEANQTNYKSMADKIKIK